MFFTPSTVRAIALFACCLLAGRQTQAVTATWNVGSGAWNNGANWTPTTVPGTSLTGDVANFSIGTGVAKIVTLDNGTTAFSPVLSTLNVSSLGTATNGLTINSGVGGTLTMAAGGTIQWNTGANTGTTNVIGAGVLMKGALNLTLNGSSAAPLMINGAIRDGGGAFGVTISGTGATTFQGANTYTGRTTVNSGTLNLNRTGGTSIAGDLTVSGGNVNLAQSNQIATTSNVNVSSGTFGIGANSNTVQGLQITGGTVSGTTGVLTSTTAYDVQGGTISAKLGGAVGLNKTGAGTATLSGLNLYTGLTTASAGTLNLNATGGASVAGNLTVSGGTVNVQQSNQIATTSNVVVSSGALNIGANNNTVNGLQVTGGTVSGTTGVLTSATSYDVQAGRISTKLGGTVGLNKTGAGTATLSGLNTYTGLTTASAGTLNLNATGGASVAGNLTVSGGTVNVQQSNQIAATSNVVVSSGALNIGANNNTVNGLQVTGGTVSGTTGVLTSTADYDVQGGSISAILGGTKGLNKSGAGTATLSASNTFSGATTVSAGKLTLNASGNNAISGNISITGGTLELSRSNQIVDSKAVSVAGGTFSILGSSETVGSLKLNGGSITGTTGVLTSASDVDAQNGTISAKLGGVAGLAKTSANTVTLTGANTYTGTTIVSAGTLNLNTSGAPAVSGNVTVTGGALVMQQGNQMAATKQLTVSGGSVNIGNNSLALGTLQLTGGTVTGTGGVITGANTHDLQSGTVSAILGGSVGATKTGTGTVSMTVPNTFTGTMTVGAGTLNLNSSTGPALAGDASVTGGTLSFKANNQMAATKNLTISGGTADIAATNQSVGTLKVAGGNVSGTTGVLTSTSDYDIQSGSVSAKLGGTAGLNKTGAGTATLSGANSFTGKTTVTSGTLNLSSTTGPSIPGDVVINGGTVSLQQNSQINSSKNVTVSSGTLALNSRNNTIAGLTLTGGTVSGATGILTSTTAFDVQAGTASGRLGGSVGLNKTGSGIATLSGVNAYTGDTVVSGGTLNLDTTGGGSVPGNLVVRTGATAALLQNQQVAAAKNIGVAGGMLDLGATASNVAGVTLTAGGQITGTGALTSASNFDLQNGGVAAVLAGTAGADVTKGSVTYTNSNTYPGPTSVANGGTLILNASAGPAIAGGLTIDSTSAVAFAQNNQLAATQPMTVAGGTLNTAGFNASVADLTLSNNGKILGAGTLNSSGTIKLQGGQVDATLAGKAGVQVSVGNTILTANNTYTGITSIQGGQLTVSGSTAGASTVIMNGGTLAGSGTIGGSVGINSGVINLTSGTIAGELQTAGGSFTGKGTVLGVLTHFGGTFTVASGAVLTANSGVTVRAGTLGVAGTIAGNVAVNSPGTIAFSGSGTITGTLGVGSGTGNVTGTGLIGGLRLAENTALDLGIGTQLTLSNGALTNSGAASIRGGTLKAGANGFKLQTDGDLFVSSNLVSTGGLVKTGSGTLYLQGNSHLGGAAQIQNGTLTLDGTLVTPQLILFAGTTFDGSGNLQGTLVNNGGTFNPGHSPGTLRISGDFSQTKSSTLVLQVQNGSVYDRVIAGGAVHLNGTLNVQDWRGHEFSYGDQVTNFIQAGKIDGHFTNVVMPSSNLRGRLVNDGQNLTLVAAPASYTLVAQTPNELQVAKALDHWIGKESGDVGVVTLALDVQRANQYAAAFNAIGPAYYSILPQTGVEHVTAHNTQLQQRFNEIHTEVQRATITARSIPSARPASAKALAGSKKKKPEPSSAATFALKEDVWTSWMQTGGQFAQFQTFMSLADSHFDTLSTTVGLDRRLGRESAAGIAVGYNYTNLAFDRGDRTTIDAGRVSLYGVAGLGNGFFLDGAVTGGYTGYDIKRPIQFSTIDRVALGRTDGNDLSAAIQFGKDFHAGNWTLTPKAGFQYARVHINGLNETNAGALNLALNGYGVQSMRGTLGGTIAYQAKLSEKVTLMPYLNASWQHEFESPAETVRAALPADGGSFRYHGGSLADDRIQAGAGFLLNIGENTTINLGYQAEFGTGDYESHMIMLMMSYRF